MNDQSSQHSVMHYVRKTHIHAMHHLKLWFIPHKENGYHPHALRPRALKAYGVLLITLKVATAAFFFAAYPSPGQFAQLTADTMVSLTNSSRAQHGLSALSTHPRLILAAESKAQDMIDKGYFSHTSPDGSRFFAWVQNAGYNYSTAGENLAMDFTSAESAHNALMASQSHKDNILNGSYVHVGMAVKTGVINGKNTTVLVEMFGAPYVPPTQVAEVEQTPTPAPAPTPAPTPAPQPAPAPTPAPEPTPEPTPEPHATVAFQSAHTVQIPQEESADMTIVLKNSGETTWNENFELRLAESSLVDLIEPVTLGKSVAPGQEITLTFDLTAPLEPGDYTIGLILGDSNTIIPGSEISLALQVSQKNPVEFASNAVASEESATPAQIALATLNTPDQQLKPLEFKNQGLVQTIASGANRFFFGFLAFLIGILILNIIIRIKVQHGHVIVQVAIVIAIAATALLTRFSFIESIGQTLQIL